MGERFPRFDEIKVRPNGKVSFVVRSPALRPDGVLKVESGDSGRTWEVVKLFLPPI
jgi:hypothetical protein